MVPVRWSVGDERVPRRLEFWGLERQLWLEHWVWGTHDGQDRSTGLWWWESGSPTTDLSTGPSGTRPIESLWSQQSNLQ